MSKIDELLKNEKVEWKKLGEVCDIIRGVRVTKKDLLENGKYPVVSGGTGYMGYINEYNRDENTITIAQYGSAGYVNWQSEKFWANDVCFSVYPNEKINKRYLYHFLLKKQDYLYSISNKSAIPYSISKEKILNIKIPVPSIEAQEKIVDTLDKLTRYVTELQEELQIELQARVKQYEYYRDMFLSEEYLNKMAKTLENRGGGYYRLRLIPLGDIAEVNRGASPRPIVNFITESTEGVPWIKISDVEPNSKYILKTKQKITKDGAKKSRLLKEGDFIISNSMSYGRPYILGIEGCIHDGWASISGYNEHLNSDFLYHYLSSHKVQRYWENKMNTASVSNLNSEIIKSLPIPVINLELQIKIAAILDKFQSLLSETEGLLPREIELRQKQYEYYREQLLNFYD